MSTLLKNNILRISNNSRQSPAHVKKRGEVSGGGAKPWRQKGTGNARVGSSRSPLWRGGGKAFGPRNIMNYSIKQNKKEIKNSLKLVLASISTSILSSSDISEINNKSKFAQKYIDNNKFSDENICFIYTKEDRNLFLAFRNLDNINSLRVEQVNILDLLKTTKLLLTPSASDFTKLLNEK